MILRLVLATILSIVTASSTYAELTLSFGNFSLNSGGQTGNLNFSVYSTTTPIEISDLNIKFTLPGSSGLAWAGTQPGNLTPLITNLGASSTLSPPSFLPSADPLIKTATWAFDPLTPMPEVPTAAVQAGYLTFDTTNLTNGTYNIPFEITAGTGPPMFPSVSSAGSGSFTVSAVPEPSSMALLGLMTAGGVAYRRLRKKKTVEAA